MYVCNCRGIRQREVTEAIEAGAARVCDVFRVMGSRPQCGRCVADIASMLSERPSWAQAQLASGD